jgi:thymidylate kinase
MRRSGRFIMVDGMTGSGKSTVMKAIRDWSHACEHRVFSLNDWHEATPPSFKDISEHDVYFTYEPTRTWVGQAIRYELSRVDNPYGGKELAHAFALDRQIMYRRLILPALEAGKTVIQDRGVSSSLVYQPVMPDSVALEDVLSLPGNSLAMEHAPDALILTKLSAQTAHERITSRQDDSKGVFADLTFMKQQEERFASSWLQSLFEKHGTSIFELDTSGTLEQSQQRATTLIDHILNTC